MSMRSMEDYLVVIATAVITTAVTWFLLSWITS